MIEHYKNISLDNIVEEIDGVVYTEEWRPIRGYEGLYEISSFGRVKGLNLVDNAGKTYPIRILKSFSSHKYRRIGLVKKGKQIKYQVHRLVANAFIPNPQNLPEVNHLFGIRWDNRVIRLEWNTSSQNKIHAFEKLGKKAILPWIGKSGLYHIRSQPVISISPEGLLREVFDTKTQAAKYFHVDIGVITRYIKSGSLFKGVYLK